MTGGRASRRYVGAHSVDGRQRQAENSTSNLSSRRAEVNVRSLFWNTGLNYFSFFFLSATGFFLTPFILAHVGEARFGVFALASSITAYASILDFGLGISTMKIIAAHASDPDRGALSRLVSSIFVLYMIIGIGITFLGLAAWPLVRSSFGIPVALHSDFAWCYALSVVAVGVTFPQSVFTACLNGLRDYAVQNSFVITTTAAGLLGSVVILSTGHGIAALTALGLGISLLQFAIKLAVVRVRHGIRVARRLAAREHVRAVGAIAGWVFIINVAAQLVFDTDVIVVGVILGPIAVASYQVALSLGTALRRIGEQLNVITLTTATSLWADRQAEKVRALYVEATRVTTLVMVPATVLVCLFGAQFLDHWVGASMSRRAYPTLVVLCAAMAVLSIQATSSQVLITVSKHKTVAYVAIVESLLNIALSVVLGGTIGISGVALGTLIPASLTTCFVSIHAASKALGLTAWAIVRPCAGVVLQGAVVFGVGQFLLGDVLAGLSLFGIAAVCGSLYAVWLAGNLFGPRESRRRYAPAILRRANVAGAV